MSGACQPWVSLRAMGPPVVRRIMASTGILVLISRTPKNILLYIAKGDFAHAIKLRILRWRYSPGLPRWAWCIHKGPYRWRRQPGKPESGEMWQRKQRLGCCRSMNQGVQATWIIMSYILNQYQYNVIRVNYISVRMKKTDLFFA